MEKASQLLFAACWRANEENKTKTWLIDEGFKLGNIFPDDSDVDSSKDSDLDSLSSEKDK